MIDEKQTFIRSIVDNPEHMHTIYFGLKAAPLTIVHERILKYLYDAFVAKYLNVRIHVGVADSPWKEKFMCLIMVNKYLKDRYPDCSEKTIKVVNQSGWQGLYQFLKAEGYDGRYTLVCVGEDEWKHIEADDGVWKDVEQFTTEFHFHMVKSRDNNISATAVRNLLFRDPNIDYFYIKDHISQWTYDWIKNNETFWQLKPNFRAEENVFISNYDASKFDRPSVTVDNIVWAENKGKKYVLLIRRKGHPYKGYWALPGGFLDVKQDKTLEDAALRELKEETSLEIPYATRTNQFKAYGDIGTDPRTRIVDVVYETKFPSTAELERGHAGDDAADLIAFNVDDLPPLAFNHAQILKEFFQIL